MNRHYARVIALQVLYECDFRESKDVVGVLERHLNNLKVTGENLDFVKELVSKTSSRIPEIDKTIEKVAPDWPIEQVAMIDRNILRISICELNDFDTPPKVVINEAIELAKTFGSETSSKFVNGVLGTVYRKSDKYVEETEGKEDGDR